MRTLLLLSPPMTGSDVSAWQQFLTAQGILPGTVDGIYGPVTTQATRDYQSSRGLTADGIAGPATFAQAARDGFAAAGASGGPAAAGMDASVNCGPFAACIVAAGMRFVARYYSQSAGKAMTRTEALALSQAGLSLAAVYQDANNGIQFFTAALGQQSAARALAQASAVGQPAGSAIYFAADFDPSPSQVNGPLTDYFRAVAQTFSAAATHYAVGVYGSGLTCRTIRDAGLATFTWLSGSTGFQESASFRPEADLVQIAPSRSICGGGLNIDDDLAQSPNFGAFQVS
jgi:peptidoglycan hydrolase-like protein with peptidoglycan-binding domain